MVRQQQIEQVIEVMDLGNMLSQFLKHRLEVFFGTRLTMEGNQVMKRLFGAGESLGSSVVGLGLSHPFARGFFHTRPCPWSRSRCEMTRLLPIATGGSPASERASPLGKGPEWPNESAPLACAGSALP